ncbi:sensor histidine kinase [Spirosoma koreense]
MSTQRTIFTDYGLLLEALPHAVLHLNPQGLITFANRAAVQLIRSTLDELIDQPFSIFYDAPGGIIKADYELSMAVKNGQFTTEGWRIRKDKTKFWGDMTLTRIQDEQSTLTGFSCLLQDNSGRKQQELELLKREERFRLMVEGIRDYAIFMLDPAGHIISWNEGARRIKGYSEAEIIGKHFSTFYTAEDLASQKPARELVIARQTGKYEEEGWRVKKNGSVFWANIVITALFNEQNQLIGFSKVTRDLTERKEADETLRQSEEQYRSLVEQVADYGIFMMDEKGRVINWNEGARRINGYSADEIIGKYFSIFYSEEDILSGKPTRELKIAQAMGKYEEEGWRIRKDGSPFWANVVITALYNPKGIHIGFSKVTRDLTERKRAEQSLRDSNDRYRRLATELQHLNDELVIANQELQQFTSVVSHDLQEPIRTMKSYLLLIDREIGPELGDAPRTYIAKTILAATRMKELIEHLLRYSQISKQELRFEKLSVQGLVEEVLQNLRSSLEDSQAHIDLDLQLDTVYGNRLQLVQLLQNLISNAIKFTAGRTPSIQLHARLDSDQVRFGVTDNGIGIAKADQTKIFEVFRRLHTVQEYAGTGIGLAICKKIIERHGGQIWVESELNQGTTFCFTLHQAEKQLPYEKI